MRKTAKHISRELGELEKFHVEQKIILDDNRGVS